MKKLAVLLVMLTAGAGAQAAGGDGPPFKKIREVAMAYLSATGCANENSVNERAVVSFSDKALGIEDAVLVSAVSDANCMGGSGSGRPTLVVLRRAPGWYLDNPDVKFAYLKVDLALSEPGAAVDLPVRAITALSFKDEQIFAEGLDYAKDDPRCCPSVQTLHRLSLQKTAAAAGEGESRDRYRWVFTPVDVQAAR